MEETILGKHSQINKEQIKEEEWNGEWDDRVILNLPLGIFAFKGTKKK